jgi:hypothetical protein
MSTRDTDPRGRPRNARPRDELGRPLSWPAVPADGGSADDVPRIPDDLRLAPAEAAEWGGRLLEEGYPFHAHEVFEAAWKSLQGPEREFWRGLAQIAVGLTHARRGNARGALALLRRGASHTREHVANSAGIDADYVAAQADAIAVRIEREGLAALPPSDLRLRLVAALG